jgi:cell fate regulator YaaT (PSP1 superfamily)
MLIEVIFKGERKEIYQNPMEFPFKVGDHVIVEAEKGEDLGVVHQLGPLLERKRPSGNVLKLLRKPSATDMENFKDNKKKELDAYKLCVKKVEKHGLEMKVVGVEYQFDGNKITFYFTADKRVDFRELVKELASEYRVRIELRQIGVRDEAKRIGGYGVCGRKLCCTTFLSEFEPITTQCAKEQNLPLNPQKLSGLCGRLLCCLMYEREFYQEQSQKLPCLSTIYETPQGQGRVVDLDVFNEMVTLELPERKYEKVCIADLKTFKVLKEGPRDPNNGNGEKKYSK